MVALHGTGVTATCVPVQIDGADWQAALFYVVAPEAPCLNAGSLTGGPFAIEMDVELHEHENGSLVELNFEIATPPTPLSGSVMFLTGHSRLHFDALSLLSRQTDLPLFVGDEYCRLLSQQRVALNTTWRDGFRHLLDESVRHDAMIRLTGRYDPDQVFGDVFARRAPAGHPVKPWEHSS